MRICMTGSSRTYGSHPRPSNLPRAGGGRNRTGTAGERRPDSSQLTPRRATTPPPRRGTRQCRSAQARHVLRDGLDLAVGQTLGDRAHLLAVRPLAAAELHQLRLGVLGELALQPRVQRRNAGTVRAVATGAGRNALGSEADAVDVLPDLRELGVGGDRRRERLRAEMRGDVAD